MGNSIIGEKKGSWLNATQSDITAVDQLISAKSAELNKVTALLSEALNAIALCNNKASPNGIFKPGCLKISGRHISTWRDQRDANSPLVDRYKKELKALQDQRASLVADVNASTLLSQQVAQTNVVTAEAAKTVAAAETVQALESTKKYGLYIGIGLGIIVLAIGGIYVFKKIK